MKRNFYTLLVIVICVIVFLVVKNKINYGNEIAKQDLVLKCEQIYETRHKSLETNRYGEERRVDALIWSPKTKSCLAYYNVKSLTPRTFLFEVWDYSNDDLVLKYHSFEYEECKMNDVVISRQSLIYKFNDKLEGDGCDLLMMRDEGIDLLTNFEIAMEELGFRK